MLGIKDKYTAFCFDEACLYIEAELGKKNGRQPRWREDGLPAASAPKEDLIGFLKGYKG